ncbi:helix-turn-helix transcriptional regulator [Streptomyces massasporeus]|uniref:helix-turn-helix transcriptional regulator n=1 Tax=Streptomyces massasporeus TaxID=67324 RepID=UPI0037F28961
MPGRFSDAPFVGRAQQLTQMAARLGRAMRSEPQIIVVDGPAGMGKTSLVRRFLADAEPGHRVLWASGEEFEMQLPYAVVAQLLTHPSQAQGESVERTGRATWPGPILPDPVEAGAVLLDVIGGSQGPSPLIMVVDDMHWADTPSLHTITFALRRLRVDRVLAVLVVRDTTDPRLPQGLRRIMHDDSTLALTLKGLSVTDVAALNCAVGPARLPRRALSRLHAHTQGNPLHTKALLQQCAPSVLGTHHAQLPAPRGYERIIVARLDECSPPTRRLVNAVSVLGTSSALHTAARVGTVPDALDALSEAMRRDLLEEASHGGAPNVAFAHPLVRAAVYQAMEPALRSRLHHAAAGIVTEPQMVLQHRVWATAGPDPDLARDLSAYAAERSRAGAWSAAASASLASARLSPQEAERTRRTLKAVEYLLLAGDISQAAEMEPALRAMPPSAQRHYVLGHLALTTGRLDDARQELDACWESCDPTTEPETVRCATEQMAWLCLIEGDGNGIVQWARRGLALPPGHRPSFLRDSLAIGLAITGRHEESVQSVGHLSDAGPPRARHELEGLLARGMLRLWNGDLGAARHDLKQAFDAHRRDGLPYAALVALGFLTDAEYRSGRWDDAIAHGTQAVSLAEDTDQVSILAVVHAFAALPLAGRGEYQAAEEHADAAAEHARVLSDVNDLALAYTAHALIRTAQGDHEQVVRLLRPLTSAEIVHRDGLDETGIIPWRALLVESLVRTGHPEKAEELLADYELRAAQRQRWLDLAAACRCRGLLEASRGRAKEAEQAFRQGLDHSDGGEACWEQALLHLSYGTSLRRAGRRSEAVVQLETAWRTFDRLRATPYLERCRIELGGCGRTTTKARAARHPVLTAQELTVARLAVRGLTNRQIARELMLSVKTVEYHLGNAYAKLGINSRMGLVAALEPK